MLASYQKSLPAASVLTFFLAFGLSLFGQSGGNSGTVSGTVLDPTGAVVASAIVEIHNPVSHFDRSTTTDSSGSFIIPNVPFNPYHMTVNAAGFASSAQDVDVRSVVPVSLKINLQVSGSSTTVTVEAGGDLVENDSTFHSDLDRDSFIKMPLESGTSAVSAAVTQSTPGIAADSNGLFTVSETTRRIRFPWTASRSLTSKAKSFLIRSHSTRSSRWKSSPARRPLNSGERPA